jgi:hypothetical protein
MTDGVNLPDSRARRFRNQFEPLLSEVPVKRQGSRELQPSHDDETHAIGQRTRVTSDEARMKVPAWVAWVWLRRPTMSAASSARTWVVVTTGLSLPMRTRATLSYDGDPMWKNSNQAEVSTKSVKAGGQRDQASGSADRLGQPYR